MNDVFLEAVSALLIIFVIFVLGVAVGSSGNKSEKQLIHKCQVAGGTFEKCYTEFAR